MTGKGQKFATTLITTALSIVAASPGVASAQSAENVAVVINDNSTDSQTIGLAYARARSIPDSNVLRIRTSTDESVDRATFLQTIEGPLAAAISRERLQDRILYLVLTKGIPLRVNGTPGQKGAVASVDSELTLLYRRMTGQAINPAGAVPNPYFLSDLDLSAAQPFTHRAHDIFLVSRLDGYTVADALALIDRAAEAKGEGRFVLDQRDTLVDRTGEIWLEEAAKRLGAQGHENLVTLETTPKPARGHSGVLGYFSWGSTDPQNRVRTSGMQFAPGAIAGSFVGSDARTFREPPKEWMPTGDPANRSSWFAGSPESLVADLIRDGVTGAAGYVAQPFVNGLVRPQILFPAYAAGFNLVEAYYLATPFVSWTSMVIGDPLCAPFPRKTLSPAEIEDGLDEVTLLPALYSKRRISVAVTQARGIPEKAVALRLRSDVLASQGDRAAARLAIDQALEIAPEFVSALLQRAAFDELEGNRDGAIESYQQIVKLEPNHVIALNNLAYALAVHRKSPMDALPLAERAVAQAPNSPTVLDTLAWIRYLLKDHAAAARLMEQVARANLSNPEVRLHAAIVFAAVGSRAMAEKELAMALKLNPALADTPEVKELRSSLGQ